MQVESSHYPESVQAWLKTPLGEALLRQEARVVEEALDGMFGEQCLQLGMWGDERTFTRFTRTQRCAVIAESNGNKRPSVIGQLHRLPVASDSVDVVLLPHTLDYSDRPQAILREADRVLTDHGHIVMLGFKTGGLWGVRRLVPGAGLPPDTVNLIAERRLRDWLQLLDFRVHGLTRYFFRWPLPGLKNNPSPHWEQRGQPLVARTGGMLYAHRPETCQHPDANTAGLERQTKGRRRAGQTHKPSVANPF